MPLAAGSFPCLATMELWPLYLPTCQPPRNRGWLEAALPLLAALYSPPPAPESSATKGSGGHGSYHWQTEDFTADHMGRAREGPGPSRQRESEHRGVLLAGPASMGDTAGSRPEGGGTHLAVAPSRSGSTSCPWPALKEEEEEEVRATSQVLLWAGQGLVAARLGGGNDGLWVPVPGPCTECIFLSSFPPP